MPVVYATRSALCRFCDQQITVDARIFKHWGLGWVHYECRTPAAEMTSQWARCGFPTMRGTACKIAVPPGGTRCLLHKQWEAR